jgi:SAM-dependent methyltransferase
MGDVNQLIFVRQHQEQLDAPFLEVGSKDYGSTQDFRSILACKGEYIGVDMADGPGVDVVLDLTRDFTEIDAKLAGRRFATIICLSVLEHCEQPFKMAENLTSLLKPKGRICVGVPFAWKIHAYPDDFWRFTPEGVRKLFPRIEFDPGRCLAATSKKNEFQALNDKFGMIVFSFTSYRTDGRILRGISAKFLKILSRFGVLSWLTGYRYLFAPTCILMLGQLKDD